MSSIRNKVQLIGRLGTKPELKEFESGKKKVSFSLATNEYYYNKAGERVEETTWHNLAAWDKTAENLSKLLDKGAEIAIEGKITNRSYEDKDGVKKYLTEIIIDEFVLFGEKVTQ
ncbi:single-stranded DNA-binding protein [Mongoliitalea daihaiensis]|uniref:single-stranded DNA-binding protein n=1 Tax=Mongoliitalea daihaiensis TaxID=2782006 RepID=UPI001F389038|nr:single-stranded DNA-binding protein [Mongoliitalea daihaiensis]UJP64594.1 single-stranded DNA-binding protein [Mongoliitalea daihaiensis]